MEPLKDSFINVTPDRFHCITLLVGQQNFSDNKHFDKKLKKSLEEWKSTGIRGVSIHIPIEHCNLIEICRNFDFHHAQPGYVRMQRWMLETEPNQLPTYASQYIGAGGFVVNDRNQILVIQEKFLKNPQWKLPGGHVDADEDIQAACKREVFEETGIDSEFVAMLSFRHQHQYRFGCSDIYFVCLMRPLHEEINKCDKEIAQCRWMDLDEYEKSSITDANSFFVGLYKKMKKEGKGIIPSPVLSFNKKVHNHVYSVQPLPEETEN